MKRNWLWDLAFVWERRSLSSRAQSKLLQHQFLFSLGRQLKLRTVLKNYLIFILGFKNNFSYRAN